MPGTYGEASIANQNITWYPGGDTANGIVWNRSVPYSSTTEPFTITAVDDNELALSRRYDIKFSSMVPEGYEIDMRVRVANATATSCDLVSGLHGEGMLVAHFVKPAPMISASLTLIEQPTVSGTSPSAGRFVQFNLPAGFTPKN